MQARAVNAISGPSQTGGATTYPRLRSFGADSLLVAILSPFLALTSSSFQRFLLAIVILDIPIEFGTYLFYRPLDAARGALKGLSISATTLALAALYISWVVRALARRTPRERSSLQINLPLVQTLSLFEVYLLLEACLICFYVANNVRTRKDVMFVVSLLLGGCLFESLVITVMKFTVTASTTWDFPIHIIAEGLGDSGRMRIGGTIGVPNVAGAYLSVMLAFAAGALFADVGKTYKWLASAVLGLGGVALIFTFSRGAWIALVFAIVVLCFVQWHQRGISLKRPVAIFVVIAVLYLPLHGVISERLFGNDQGSAESRIPLNKLAFRMIADNPVLGVGANNFTSAMDQYATSEFRHEWLWAVHNKYLLILAETGAGGLLAYLAFLLSTLRKGWQCWKLGDSVLSPLALGLVAAIAGHMVHQGVDLFRDRPLQQLLLLVAGLLAAMHRICATDRRRIPHSATV